MYQYPIELTLKTGVLIAGTARDTCYNADREECIKLEGELQEQIVPLHAISSMQVTVDNPHLDKVNFDS